MTQIDRITEMEKCFDASRAAADRLEEALEEYEAILKSYKKLSDYYGSPRWIKDFEDDEAGKLPKDLKRGVLSEDSVYDLLTDNREIYRKMMKIISRALDQNLL